MLDINSQRSMKHEFLAEFQKALGRLIEIKRQDIGSISLISQNQFGFISFTKLHNSDQFSDNFHDAGSLKSCTFLSKSISSILREDSNQQMMKEIQISMRLQNSAFLKLLAYNLNESSPTNSSDDDSTKLRTLKPYSNSDLIHSDSDTINNPIDHSFPSLYNLTCHISFFYEMSNQFENLHTFLHNKYRMSNYGNNGDIINNSGVNNNQIPTKKHLEPDILQNSQAHSNIVKYNDLVDISKQIAEAMGYLESLGLVHRDLAARNCIIRSIKYYCDTNQDDDHLRRRNPQLQHHKQQNYQVKITDVAISVPIFQNQYVDCSTTSNIDNPLYTNRNSSHNTISLSIEPRKIILPLRYMSPECVLQGSYSPKSDVWSFGTLLWEILMYCSQLPFRNRSELTLHPDIFISNFHKLQMGLPDAILPCYDIINSNFNFQTTDEIIFDLDCYQIDDNIKNLIRECWHKNPCHRPNFTSICSFLDNKAMSF